ncbi:TetR/AcrR family transcriptional regulator [Phenylobacterium sp.]|uniref:TetR/AcrR family transcriptional regulator n=1 Tax=Phenylobacterium sp. TaxID=1871053 RepID=UPI0027365179|nr:TetR/AcrR family transcriptional regulator [Phenylobacterium sp.]MDP3661196.1 TetR/AcrR family transcriptional regulator [Phenylobacterium sp.]
MNTVTDKVSCDQATARPLTRRAMAKQQTRSKVMIAARGLFREKGYEGATIRDIANAAGMSTGAVFANFADKSDLFQAITVEDVMELTVAMRGAAERGRGIEDALLKMFAAGYAYYKPQMPLARAAFAVSWSAQDGLALRDLPCMNNILELIGEQMSLAVGRGELSQEAEVRLRSQMLYDAYLANFGQAVFNGWSLDALSARMRDQIRILLSGARRG